MVTDKKHTVLCVEKISLFLTEVTLHDIVTCDIFAQATHIATSLKMLALSLRSSEDSALVDVLGSS